MKNETVGGDGSGQNSPESKNNKVLKGLCVGIGACVYGGQWENQESWWCHLAWKPENRATDTWSRENCSSLFSSGGPSTDGVVPPHIELTQPTDSTGNALTDGTTKKCSAGWVCLSRHSFSKLVRALYSVLLILPADRDWCSTAGVCSVSSLTALCCVAVWGLFVQHELQNHLVSTQNNFLGFWWLFLDSVDELSRVSIVTAKSPIQEDRLSAHVWRSPLISFRILALRS